MGVPVGVLPANGLVLGDGDPWRFPLGGRELAIGRDPACDVVIRQIPVGRRHARLIARAEGGYWIEDTLSPAGTYRNGERVQFAPLTSGDVVQIAGMRLRFEHGAPASGRAPVPRDEEARLVLADSLGDRGDAQGEFIHYQTALDRLPEVDSRHAELATLAQILLHRHEREWVAPLPLPVEDWRFRHGGLAAVRLDARRVLDETAALEALLDAHPIRCLAFVPGTLDEGLLAALSRTPEKLARFTQIELPRGLTDRGLEARFGGGNGVYGPETPYWDRYSMS